MIRKLPNGWGWIRSTVAIGTQPAPLTGWDLVLKIGLGEHARHNGTYNRKGPSRPNRLTDNQQTNEENLYAIHYGRYGKLRQHRSLL